MKRTNIIIDFKYNCYPVWIYNDRDELIINDLPWELSEETEIDDSLTEIQSIYNSLFIKNAKGLQYIGFKSESDKIQFIKMIDMAINLIKMKAGTLFIIEKKYEGML